MATVRDRGMNEAARTADATRGDTNILPSPRLTAVGLWPHDWNSLFKNVRVFHRVNSFKQRRVWYCLHRLTASAANTSGILHTSLSKIRGDWRYSSTRLVSPRISDER